MSSHHTQYEIFLSYSRKDNAPIPPGAATGWVTALRDHILTDHRRFSTEPLHIFFDTAEIHDMDDWRHRIEGALRHSRILLICLSPNYFASPYCRWEWDAYHRRQVHHLAGSDSVATVYFVEAPGSSERENAAWMEQILRGNYTDIRPWFPAGAAALQEAEVKRRLADLGDSLWERIRRSRRAEDVPGNLRRQTPYFVGRRDELRRLHEQLATGAVGVVTAVHGLGGIGKTELAVAYARGWADWYPAGLWVLGAESRQELLPLIGELAFAPEFGYQPGEAERADPALLGRAVLAELHRRADTARARTPHGAHAALLILDNVSDARLLSASQLALLPREDWLRIVATTRLGPGDLHRLEKTLAFVPVDSLDEEDAVALIRDHQPQRQAGRIVSETEDGAPEFASAADEAAARELARELGGFTLAVEQAAVYLALLRRRGLPSLDEVPADADVAAQMLHREKQLALILDETLARLDAPTRTALHYAAAFPPDTIPWPWLRELTARRHPELEGAAPGEPDLWISIRRRLAGFRLLTEGEEPEIGRLHRLVAAHLAAGGGAVSPDEVMAYVAARADAVYRMKGAPNGWELNALLAAVPALLTGQSGSGSSEARRRLAVAAVFLSDIVIAYRNLQAARSLLTPVHVVLQNAAEADPGNAASARDVYVSNVKLGDVAVSAGDTTAARSYFEQGLQIARRLAEADSGNAAFARDLSISYDRLARLEGGLQTEEGRRRFRAARDVLRELKRGNRLPDAQIAQYLEWLEKNALD